MDVSSHFHQGCAAYSQGEFVLAVSHLEKARAMAPGDAIVLNQLGNALKHAGEFERAVKIQKNIIRILNGTPEAISNLATTYLLWGRTEQAVQLFSRAVKLRRNDPKLLYNLATALQLHGDHEQAVGYFEETLANNPKDFHALENLGITLKHLGRFEEALCAQIQAVSLMPESPDVNWNLALTELLLGHYESGFRRYEFRRQISGFKSIGGRPWDGNTTQSKVVVYSEQGMGDTFQFIRYLPMAKAKAPNIQFMCRPAMVPVLRAGLPSDIDIIPRSRVEDTILCAPLLSLPHLLNHPTPFAPKHPYLKADSTRIAEWKTLINTDSRLKVGLCWQGNPQHQDDPNRSISLSELKPLLFNREVQFFSLQKSDGLEQLGDLPSQFNVIDLGNVMDDGGAFLDTAAVISNMDLVISVDTSIAHLSGALGCDTWTLLPFNPDFRWGLLSSTAYYPQMRLFRQTSKGNWTNVIADLCDSLLERTLPARYWI